MLMLKRSLVLCTTLAFVAPWALAQDPAAPAAAPAAHTAPTAASAVARVSWVAPTQGTDGKPLGSPVTRYEVFWTLGKPIPDNTTAAGDGIRKIDVASGTNHTIQPSADPAGKTLHARVRACNAAGCSALSAETTKVFPAAGANTPPAVPTSVTITFQ